MSEEVDILKRALERERGARKQAEELLEAKAREAYFQKEELVALAGRLEHMVIDRTRELAVARDEAVAASRAKSQFLANMSHELRTPLNAILGYSEMLEEDARAQGRGEASADLRKIIAAGKHLLTLINDILDLSKIEAGQMDVYYESVEPAALVRELCGTIEPLLGKNGNELSLELGSDLGTIQTDVMKVRQILFNLLSNAAKFTRGGSVGLRVERKSDAQGEHVRMVVTDTGVGMTSEQVAALFTPFKQADASTSRKYGGTGLGLAITERFCAMLDATLTVESTPEKGSVFTVRLPVGPRAPRSLSPLPLAHDAADAPEGTTSQPDHAAEGTRGTVLVIDDDPVVRDLLGRTLRAEGFGVATAVDGQQGLEQARKVRPIAITLEVLMPRLDGWSMMSALQADPELSGIPVIVVSVVDQRGIGAALGARAFVPKPVERARLLEALDRHAHPRQESAP
jgi:signal transduction histidine kinase/CheY-like chemotaxis protein